MRAAAVAAVASGLLIAVACVAVGLQRQRHQLGTNFVRPVTFVRDLPAHARLCQRGERIPAGTGAIGMRIGTFNRPGPALDVTIRAPRQAIARGSLPTGWRQGDIVVPVPVLAADRRDASVCVEHGGPGPLAIAGGSGVGSPATVDGDDVGGMIRLEYVERERRSWFTFVPDMLDRLAVARDALPGPATLPVFVLLALGVLGGSLLLVVREGRR